MLSSIPGRTVFLGRCRSGAPPGSTRVSRPTFWTLFSPFRYSPRKRLARKMAVSAAPQEKASGGIPMVVLAIIGLALIVVGLFFPVGLATVEIKASPIAQIGSYAIT